MPKHARRSADSAGSSCARELHRECQAIGTVNWKTRGAPVACGVSCGALGLPQKAAVANTHPATTAVGLGPHESSRSRCACIMLRLARSHDAHRLVHSSELVSTPICVLFQEPPTAAKHLRQRQSLQGLCLGVKGSRPASAVRIAPIQSVPSKRKPTARAVGVNEGVAVPSNSEW